MFKPFSENIIFLDAEFSTLDPYKGEILSLGMVKLSGEEFYIELEYDGEYNEWVRINILPILKGSKLSREEAKKRIIDFVGTDKPFMIAYANQFDAVFFYKLVGLEDNPFMWVPIDFAAVLFALGIDPESYTEGGMELLKKLEIDLNQYQIHNALDDAKLLKETYLKLKDSNLGS